MVLPIPDEVVGRIRIPETGDVRAANVVLVLLSDDVHHGSLDLDTGFRDFFHGILVVTTLEGWLRPKKANTRTDAGDFPQPEQTRVSG